MKPLRVLTLNIWNRSGPWEHRRELIRGALRELAPDVVALNEVMRLQAAGLCQARELADGLGFATAWAPALEAGGGLFMGNAILSRFPIVRSAFEPLPVGRDDDGRSLFFAALDAPFGELPFFVTHLSWRFHEGAVRLRQARAIAAHVARLAPIGEGFPAVLCGDFNASPDADEIRYLRGRHAVEDDSVYFADAWDWRGNGPGHTWCERNPFTAPVMEPDRRLDYVFVRGPDGRGRGRPLAARVVCDAPDESGVHPSDHFGVLAELQCEPDDAGARP